MRSADKPKSKGIEWQGRRIIPSRFPPISIFERVVDLSDLDEAYFIESLTNDRLRDEAGDIALVPTEDRICGPGTSPIMAAFTHIGKPSRFTDGTFGVYYAASDSKTAIAETCHHRAAFFMATNEPDTKITMREYVGRILLPMQDVTHSHYAQLHHPNDYSASQHFAALSRANGESGILYNSVRHKGGLCIAVFKPRALAPVMQCAHYEYIYSAKRREISNVYEIREVF